MVAYYCHLHARYINMFTVWPMGRAQLVHSVSVWIFFVVFICLFVLLNPYGCIMPPKKIKMHFPLFNGWFMYNHCVCMFLSSSACLIVNSIIPFFPLFACLFICHPSGLPYIINTLTHYLWISSIHFFDLLNIILYFFVIWYFFKFV